MSIILAKEIRHKNEEWRDPFKSDDFGMTLLSKYQGLTEWVSKSFIWSKQIKADSTDADLEVKGCSSLSCIQ